jgi:cytosine deaminase
MTSQPPLAGSLACRLPRSLLDPSLGGLPPTGDDGTVALELGHHLGRITTVRPWDGSRQHQDRHHLPLALTPLVEPHAHLDKCFTAEQYPNPGGGMDGAMEQNRREAAERTYELVSQRAEAALERAWRYGLRAIRSHVDSGGPATRACWEALLRLQRRWAGRVELQLVALTPLGFWSTPEGEDLACWVADRSGLLGGVLGPPYAHARADEAALTVLLQLAERLGVGVDLHVDEADQQPGLGVSLLLRVVQRLRPSIPITCSHAASLALMPQRRLERLADQLAAAEMAIVALPLTNLWLLGRRSSRTPMMRVQAPIRCLQRAGVTVAVGGDNVQDPWYPGGDFDPIEVLRLAPLTSHLWPGHRQGLVPLTTAGARLQGLSWDGVVRQGAPADLLLLGAGSWTELLARSPQRQVWRSGQLLPPPPTQQPQQPFRAISMG